MLRTILKITFIIAVIALILYLLPQDTKRAAKEKALALISKILPTSAKEKITNLSLSPEEKRAKFIAELEKNLNQIKQDVENNNANSNSTTSTKNAASVNTNSTKNIIQNIEQSQTLLNEIKENNGNQGIIQKTVTSLTTTIKNLVTNSTSTQTITPSSCVCE